MSKRSVPKIFGVFRHVSNPVELMEIRRTLSDQLPRSRRIYDSITIASRGFESSSPIYVPKGTLSSDLI
jgi:hypothetical protein